MEQSAIKLLRKYDWDLGFALYCAGYTWEQIAAHPKFQGITVSQIKLKGRDNDWPSRREKLAHEPLGRALDNAAKRLQERLIEEGIAHQDFILSELSHERAVFKRRPRTMEDQSARLDVLKKLDDIARKVSKLDDEKPANVNNNNFAFLVHLQTNTHRGNQKAPTGILRSNNAHPEQGQEAEMQDFTVSVERAEPKKCNTCPQDPPRDVKPMPFTLASLFGQGPIEPANPS